MPGFGVPALPEKKTPASSVQLKSFNWTKVPPIKLKDTLWMELKDGAVYDKLDRTDFDSMFTAYQHKHVEATGTKEAEDDDASKQKELSFIDHRRAQNCTILLSRLRMANREIHHAVLSMDEEGRIPNDLVEIMLNFVPTSEEKAALEKLQDQVHMFAIADRFFWDVSRIPRYEQRLSSLVFKRKLPERLAFIKPRISSVLQASRQLIASPAFKSLLELILALGNYMNRGPRGNAYGFQLQSLLKIGDTKASKQKDYTLLHYLVHIVDDVPAFAPIRPLAAELGDVSEASKVNFSELNKDLGLLRTGLQTVTSELEWHKTQTTHMEGDLYEDVMEDFMRDAKRNMADLETNYAAMMKQYQTTVKSLAEDPAEKGPDEFFGTVDQFLARMAEARADVAAMRRREEEERRKKEVAAAAQAAQAEKNKKKGQQAAGPELDDLISTLRSGECFGSETDVRRARKGRK